MVGRGSRTADRLSQPPGKIERVIGRADRRAEPRRVQHVFSVLRFVPRPYNRSEPLAVLGTGVSWANGSARLSELMPRSRKNIVNVANRAGSFGSLAPPRIGMSRSSSLAKPETRRRIRRLLYCPWAARLSC